MTVAFEGYLIKYSTRECDANKNPVEDWKIRYQASSRAYNPYVYSTKGIAKRWAREPHKYSPVYDWKAIPSGLDWKQRQQWLETARPLKYYEQKCEVVKAQIVEVNNE